MFLKRLVERVFKQKPYVKKGQGSSSVEPLLPKGLLCHIAPGDTVAVFSAAGAPVAAWPVHSGLLEQEGVGLEGGGGRVILQNGVLRVEGDLRVEGSLEVTGAISAQGDITAGPLGAQASLLTHTHPVGNVQSGVPILK